MKAPVVAILLSLAWSVPTVAETFVYVSNAEDGDIGMYTLQANGSLQPGPRVTAAKIVMPMAVSPDKALPHRRRPLQAVRSVQLRHRQELGRAESRWQGTARGKLSVYHH
jgi:hypothetical protein